MVEIVVMRAADCTGCAFFVRVPYIGIDSTRRTTKGIRRNSRYFVIQTIYIYIMEPVTVPRRSLSRRKISLLD